MSSTSAMRGTLRSMKRPSAIRLAAISLRAEFLAPSIRTGPSRGPLGRTMIRSTPSVSSEDGPGGLGVPLGAEAGVGAPAGKGNLVARVVRRFEVDEAG